MSMKPGNDSKYLDPDYLVHDGTIEVYASILESADACGLYNVVANELFLTLIEYKSLIDRFRVTLEEINASPVPVDPDQRQAMADAFRKNALEANGVIPRISAFVDYLADCIRG